MDIEGVRTFIRVAELGSFTRAGEQLGMSKARVSVRLQQLEAEVGSRLLQRSTRAVKLTADGEQFLPNARRLVAQAEELSTMFQAARTLRGRVRIDLPQRIASSIFIPRLPELLAAHPQLELQMSTTDRRVDLVREGFDCVLRVGKLTDSGLVARKVGSFTMANYASPSYLEQYGVPRTIEDLDRHLLVHYSSSFGADTPGFEYLDGAIYRERPMRSIVTVNSTDSYEAACIAGLGIIQAPRFGRLANLADGAVVEVLRGFTCEPMPVSLVQAQRHVPKRVRAVISWIEQILALHLEPA
jgi:DNA-binding transcriptional LysR family regulator